MSVLALLIGCSGTAPEPAPPPAPTIDLSAEPVTFQQCIEQDCPDGLTDPAALEQCRQKTCAAKAATWGLSPGPVRYSDGILSVEVAVDHTPVGHGSISVAHESEVWLGVTVLTEDGADIDLAVQTVFPDRINEPFVFTSEVGDGVRDIIFGLWGKRIEPCDVARSGCQMFGFVLDESLAAWPPLTYTESPPRRQRILSAPVTLQVINAGAPLHASQKMETDALAALSTEAGRFDVSVTGLPLALAEAASDGIIVEHRDDHDGPIASILAPEGAEVRHNPAASADFLLIAGGPSERLACIQSKCGEDLTASCDCP